MLKHIRMHLPTIISIILAAVILVAALTWFRGSVDGITETSTETYLKENTRALALVFGTKLDDRLIMLESQARYFRDIDFSDHNAMKDTIMSTKGMGAFKTIGVANTNGATVNYNGKTSGNLLLTEVFTDAMKGNTALSETFIKDEDGEDVLFAAVPILQEGAVVGAVYGTFTKSDLSSLLNSASFGGRTTNFVIANDGLVLAQSADNSLINVKTMNFFSEVGISQPSGREDTVVRCRINGADGVHDWYFVSLLPQSIIDEQSSEISGNVAAIMMIVAFAFVLLFMPIPYLIKSYEVITKSNEKFKLVTVESQDVIFDYDFRQQHLTLDGYVDNIVPEGRTSFSKDEAAATLGYIHPDDAAVVKQLTELRSNDATSIRGEFRIRCLDDTYCWFRMKATVVRMHDGSPQQMVGSLINVDDQMNHETRMIQKADTDPLTGIFSKCAFHTHVSEKLEDASDSDLFAVYVTDLDDFGKVNDLLGHAMGDQVLSDVAKKLCIVFSDKDYVGRVGGDKFAAFLRLPSKARSLGMNIIEEKAKAICTQINETYRGRKKEVTVSASVGVAIYPYSARSYNKLYEDAETALRKVKNNGKNSYIIYSPETNDESEKKERQK